MTQARRQRSNWRAPRGVIDVPIQLKLKTV